MSGWTYLNRGRLQWLVRSDWQDRLFDANGLRLDSWRAEGRLQVLKQAVHRTIYHVQLPEAACFIKHYPVHDIRAYLRQRLRPAKARTELATALALAERQVPTIEPIAAGEGHAGESYLISRAVQGAEQLDDFFHRMIEQGSPQRDYPQRRDLARRLGEFLARLHEAGVIHSDLHVGNLLIRPETLELYLIDLHAVRLTQPLDWPQSKANLLLLNRWMLGRTERADRRRFWRAYVQARRIRSTGRADEHERARELEAATQESLETIWPRRVQRCLENGRHFYGLHQNRNEAWAVSDFPAEVLQAFLAEPDRPFACSAARVVKDGRSATVCQFELVLAGVKRRVVYKRFCASRPSEPWVHLVRSTPAMRSWVNGHALLDRGLPTARPLAVVQRRRFGIVHESYLLTELIPGARDLRTHVGNLEREPADRRHELFRALVERVAVLARGLHERGLSQRDFKASNILVQPNPTGPSPRTVHVPFRSWPRLFLVDLEGVDRRRRLSRRRKVQNLARLHASFHNHPLLTSTEKLRFLRSYLRWGLFGKKGWKEWWRAIARATQRKIEQNRRRGRVLT